MALCSIEAVDEPHPWKGATHFKDNLQIVWSCWENDMQTREKLKNVNVQFKNYISWHFNLPDFRSQPPKCENTYPENFLA